MAARLATAATAYPCHQRLVLKALLACPAEGPSPIPDSDKAAVRDNLLEGVMRAPPLVRTQLGESVKAIASRAAEPVLPGLPGTLPPHTPHASRCLRSCKT